MITTLYPASQCINYLIYRKQTTGSIHQVETVCVRVCLPGAVLLQFKDMDRLCVTRGTQELGVCAEGQ